MRFVPPKQSDSVARKLHSIALDGITGTGHFQVLPSNWGRIIGNENNDECNFKGLRGMRRNAKS